MWCRVWPTHRSTHLGTNQAQGTPLPGARNHSLLLQSNTPLTDGSHQLVAVLFSPRTDSRDGRRLVNAQIRHGREVCFK